MVEQLPEELRSLGNGTDVDCDITLPNSKIVCSMRIQNVKEGAITRVRYKRFNESLKLELWLELAILTLEKKGEYCEAHLVTRGETPKKPKPVYKKIVLEGDTPEERIRHANIVIARVEGMYNAALNGAPPYFEKASYELSKGEKKKARGAFESDLAYSEENAYIFGNRDVEEIFNEKLTSKDYALLHRDDDNPGNIKKRADFYAKHVWDAYTETTMMTEPKAADSSPAVGDTK